MVNRDAKQDHRQQIWAVVVFVVLFAVLLLDLKNIVIQRYSLQPNGELQQVQTEYSQ